MGLLESKRPLRDYRDKVRKLWVLLILSTSLSGCPASYYRGGSCQLPQCGGDMQFNHSYYGDDPDPMCHLKWRKAKESNYRDPLDLYTLEEESVVIPYALVSSQYREQQYWHEQQQQQQQKQQQQQFPKCRSL